MTRSALLLIDIQNDYFPTFPGSKMALPAMDAAAEMAANLLSAARESDVKVVHVKHVMASEKAPFFRPQSLGAEIHERVAPLAGETVIEKTRPSSYVDTGLEELLREAEIKHLIICGAMSQMCIDATVRASVDLGFGVTVAHDACAAANVAHAGTKVPADMVHAAIMAPLAASYAEVLSTSEIIPRLKS